MQVAAAEVQAQADAVVSGLKKHIADLSGRLATCLQTRVGAEVDEISVPAVQSRKATRGLCPVLLRRMYVGLRACAHQAALLS